MKLSDFNKKFGEGTDFDLDYGKLLIIVLLVYIAFQVSQESKMKFVVDCWDMIMDHERNPLSNIKDLNIRHMVMQVMAFMWSLVFAVLIADSFFIFGISAFAHAFFITALVITVAVFKQARTNPGSFNFIEGYHSIGRSRAATYREVDGKLERVALPKGDPGGEHEQRLVCMNC